MSFISIGIIGFGLAMDALAITFAKAMGDCNMSKQDGLKMISLFGLFQGLMPILGYGLGAIFSDVIQQYDHWVIAFILVIIGGKMIVDRNQSEQIDCALDWKTIICLAIATSIDAFAVGITFAFLDVNIVYGALIIAIITFVICLFGLNFGQRCGTFLKDKADIIGGCILIFMAFRVLVVHLGG